MFIAALFTIARTWKQPRCLLTDEWMKNTHTHTHTEKYYSAMKKNKFESVLVRWMNLKPVIQSEVSQKEKNYYINAHIWNLEKWTDEPICRAGIEMQS